MLKASVGTVGLVVMLGLGACQSTTGKTAGESMADSAITATVQSRLTADRVSNFSRVDVDTESGAVSLSGVVQSTEQKIHAEALARQVKGVTKVENNLQIQRQGDEAGRRIRID